MKRSGYTTAATNLAVIGLMRKKLVEEREVQFEEYSDDRLFVSELGADWLLANEHKLNLRLPSASPAAEITDDDIPF